VLTYRCLHGLAPRYLSDYIQSVAVFNCRRLRSSSSSQLVIRRTRLSTVDDRAFPVAASGTVCRPTSPQLQRCMFSETASKLISFPDHLLPNCFRFLVLHTVYLCLTGLPEVAMPSSDTPAHQAMLRQVELSVGRPPGPLWKRPPGRPRTKWTDQLRRDNNNVPIATLWRQVIGRGHSKATLRSQPTTR